MSRHRCAQILHSLPLFNLQNKAKQTRFDLGVWFLHFHTHTRSCCYVLMRTPHWRHTFPSDPDTPNRHQRTSQDEGRLLRHPASPVSQTEQIAKTNSQLDCTKCARLRGNSQDRLRTVDIQTVVTIKQHSPVILTLHSLIKPLLIANMLIKMLQTGLNCCCSEKGAMWTQEMEREMAPSKLLGQVSPPKLC